MRCLEHLDKRAVAFFLCLRSSQSKLKQQDSLRRIGRTEEVQCRFFAISAERKVKHPAVVAICDTARRDLFDVKLGMTAA